MPINWILRHKPQQLQGKSCIGNVHALLIQSCFGVRDEFECLDESHVAWIFSFAYALALILLYVCCPVRDNMLCHNWMNVKV